ncbi:MAG: hypothetical protein ACYDA2_05930 [Acidimicrobiales bacterium]
MTSTPSAVDLAAPAEPVELRDALRDAMLAGDDWEAARARGLDAAGALWSAWGPTLEPAGMRRPDFDAVVAGYRRELWFWLLGDRIWDQIVPGLRGRVLRRLTGA